MAENVAGAHDNGRLVVRRVLDDLPELVSKIPSAPDEVLVLYVKEAVQHVEAYDLVLGARIVDQIDCISCTSYEEDARFVSAVLAACHEGARNAEQVIAHFLESSQS